MTKIRAVLFDLGHTVWDFAPREQAYRLKILRLHERLADDLGANAPSPHAIERALNGVFQRWNERYERDLDQPPSTWFLAEALRALNITPAPALVEALTEILFGTEPDIPVVEPDTVATLAQLDAQGLTLGCVTNTLTLERGIHDALYRLGLRRYLRTVVVSSAMGYHKPHPSLFRRALDEVGIAAQEAVFVGDSLRADIAGAKAVGMRAVLTHQYRQEPLEGTPTPPDAVIQRLSELPAVLRQLGS